MIKFNAQDIATPGAAIEAKDVWETIKLADPADLKARLKAVQPYSQFLATPYWRAVANTVKDRDGRKCRTCESTDRLEVHHPVKSYEEIRCVEHLYIGRLITLCHSCHSKLHGKPERPKPSAYKPSAMVVVYSEKGERVMTRKQMKALRRKERKEREAKKRAEYHAEQQKTMAQGENSLCMEDLLVHASIHQNFNYRRLAEWLDAAPGRWERYRSVADANRAMRTMQ